MTTHRINLPWTKPPLTENDRLHWAAKARVVKEMRQTTWLLAQKLPRAEFLVVTLHYRPRTRRFRDAHNLTPTLKACCDGIVDARIVPQDDTTHVSTPEPIIHEPGEPALWLELDYRQYRPSGLDEFAADTTTNPHPSGDAA